MFYLRCEAPEGVRIINRMITCTGCEETRMAIMRHPFRIRLATPWVVSRVLAPGTLPQFDDFRCAATHGCCVRALQVAVTHKPHARSASFAGGRPNHGETLDMWHAMLDNRARAYFSTVAAGRAWFANCTKKKNGFNNLLPSFLKQVLSKEATTANYNKCMRTVRTRVPSHTSAQPLAAHPAHKASDKQTPPPKTEGDCPT